MRFLKLALVASAVAILTSIACSTTTNTNQTQTVANTNSGAAPPTTLTPGTTSTATPPPAAAGNSNMNAASADEFAQTRALYTQHCVSCHGPTGDGQKMGQMKIPSLKTGHVLTHTDAKLADYITNGEAKAGMPAFKNKLSKEQIDDMVRYIKQELQGRKGTKGKAPAKATS